MALKTNTLKNYNTNVLLMAIIIMFIPFFVSLVVLKHSEYLMPMITLAYVIQIIMIAKSFMTDVLDFRMVILAAAYSIIQLLAMGSDAILGLNINYYDYINIIAKTVNYLLFFGIMINIRITKDQIIGFMKGIVIFATIACLYNLIFYWSDIMRLQSITSSYQVDIKSFFPNRNQFGMFLFLAIVSHHYASFTKSKNKLHYLIHFLFFINLVLTMSRASILAVIVFYGILYIQNIKNPKILFALALLAIVASVVIMTNSQIKQFIIFKIIRAQVGSTGRSGVWSMGFNVYIQNNFLNGVGFYTGLDMAKSLGFKLDQFHNFFVDTLVSGGLLELILLLSTVIYVYRRFVVRCWDKGYTKIFKASIAAIFVVSLFESISIFSIGFVDTIYTIFFITIPILMSNMKMTEEDLPKAGLTKA